MIKYNKFDKRYQKYTEAEAQKYITSDECLGDNHYYSALRMIGCSPDKLCTSSDEDMYPEDWESLLRYIEEHTVNKVDHGEYASGHPYSGLTDEFYIRTDNDNYYTIVYAIDYGFEWMYFSEDFIKEYSDTFEIDIMSENLIIPFKA